MDKITLADSSSSRVEAEFTLVLLAILASDPIRRSLLEIVRRVDLPDCWIAAGFVRNAVWDHLHCRPPVPPSGDVDVIWFDPARASEAHDSSIEADLRRVAPGIDWSVKNQARMHLRNGDEPYGSASDAMRHWVETASAVAVRATTEARLEVAAPFGLKDLFGLVLRPTPAYGGKNAARFVERVAAKGWCRDWPRLGIAAAIQA